MEGKEFTSDDGTAVGVAGGADITNNEREMGILSGALFEGPMHVEIELVIKCLFRKDIEHGRRIGDTAEGAEGVYRNAVVILEGISVGT